jgi:hypothetical protein
VTTQESDAGYFRREWRQAVDRAHDMAGRATFLIPVVIDDTNEREAEVPDEFRSVQWTRLQNGETPTAFVDRVRGLLQSKGARIDSTRPISMPSAAPATLRCRVRLLRKDRIGLAQAARVSAPEIGRTLHGPTSRQWCG